jgi:tRNA nucleotidyltransferase/poly(A) polymerase
MNISKRDMAIIKRNAPLLKKISSERIKQELDKIIISPHRSKGLSLLLKTDLLKHFAPELEKLNSTPQSNNYHSEGNVWVHTLMALGLIQGDADLRTLYGMLFHDIGKAETFRRIRRDGRPHTTFHNHQNVGTEITGKILSRLRFSNAEIADILWFVRHHHVPYELQKMRKGKQVRWVLDPRFKDLLKIYRADSLASIPTDKKGRRHKPSLESYNFSKNIWRRVSTKKVLKKKLLTGEDVMRILKIGSGPRVGEVLRAVQENQYAGKLKTRQDALAFLKKL